jgi:hypothetical protein
MTKEELLELMSEERPSQKLKEVLDFRPSECGIEGVLYDVDVVVEHWFVYESSTTKTHFNMPYPVKPYKDHNDKKVDKMLDYSKEDLAVWDSGKWMEEKKRVEELEHKYEDVLGSLLSIYDRLCKVDNECIATGIDLPDFGLRKNETLSEMFFRVLKIDLNKELGFSHLKPVKKPTDVDNN